MGFLRCGSWSAIRQARLCSTVGNYSRKFSTGPFENYVRERRNQAEKSLLIQVSDSESAPQVEAYLTSNFGPLDNLFHYTLPNPTKRIGSNITSGASYHWVVAEFSEKSDLQHALRAGRFQEDVIPYESTLCWFSQATITSKKSRKQRQRVNVASEDFTATIPKFEFSAERSVSEQIIAFEKMFELTEVAIRLRFIVCHNLEIAMSCLFPRGAVLPFGSTVNGIGQRSGDLDLVVLPDKSEFFKKEDRNNQETRLWYQSKMLAFGSTSNGRFQSQRVMETMADIIQLFIPGCTQIMRILNARVPILRFMNEFTNLQCDLSILNSTGVFMAELLFLMKIIDSRFSSLFFILRAWGAERKLIQPATRKPTNFMLALLLIYYLQQKSILPTFDLLFNNAKKNEARITRDGIDCTFLRDPQRLKAYFTPQNGDKSLEELLHGFFQFYGTFDFENKGISLFTGGSWKKPDVGALYIQNPLERHLNVARNVGPEEITKFKNECTAAMWTLAPSSSSSTSKKLNKLALLLSPVEYGKSDKTFKLKEIFQD